MEIEFNYNINRTLWHKKGDMSYWHREDGPAVINHMHGDTREWWWYHDKNLTPDRMPLNLFLAYVKWELKKHGN